MRLSSPIFRLKRRARLMARQSAMPLGKALDLVARREGFRSWSQLAASQAGRRPVSEILAQLQSGDLLLLGARPGHGKTMLGLELAVGAARAGRQGIFFTLEYNEANVLERLRSIGVDPAAVGVSFVLDTSDDICADYIVSRLRNLPAGSLAVIDYLQILDQKRRNSDLASQISHLNSCARASGAIVVAISQIDRSFDLGARRMPDLSDVRLPNPCDLTLFTKTCFLHDGEVHLNVVPHG